MFTLFMKGRQLAQEHKHLIIRAEVNNPPKDPQWATEWLKYLVPKIGMKILMGPYSTYCDMPGNAGLTCAVIIETSHIAMHVFDETSPAEVQFDIYTCSSLDVNLIFEELQQFDPVKIEYKFLEEGIWVFEDIQGTYYRGDGWTTDDDVEWEYSTARKATIEEIASLFDCSFWDSE